MTANAQTDQSAGALDKDQGSGWSVCCRCTCGSQQDTRSLFKAHVYRLLLKRPNYRQFQIHSIHCDVPLTELLEVEVYFELYRPYETNATLNQLKEAVLALFPPPFPAPSIAPPWSSTLPCDWPVTQRSPAKAYQLSCSEASESCHFSYEAP